MRYLLTMALFAGLLAGCSAASSLENATQAASPVRNGDVVGITKPPTSETPTEDTTSVSNPMAITVNPPKIPIGPVQGTPPVTSSLPEGWKTFTSQSLGVAVDYPPDWSVNETDAGVQFLSSQGQPIQLQTEQSNDTTALNAQDCATLINSYGQAVNLCFDAATHAYRAVFKKSTDGSTPGLILSTISQEKPTVFFQMFNSLRFTP
jgi:hypothetical protein